MRPIVPFDDMIRPWATGAGIRRQPESARDPNLSSVPRVAFRVGLIARRIRIGGFGSALDSVDLPSHYLPAGRRSPHRGRIHHAIIGKFA